MPEVKVQPFVRTEQLTSGPHDLDDDMRDKHFAFKQELALHDGRVEAGEAEPDAKTGAEPVSVMPIDDPHMINNDDMIFRHLIAKKWDVKLANQSLQEYVKFRRDQRVNTIFEDHEFAGDLIRAQMCGYFGKDREGYPVYYDRPNPGEITKLLGAEPREVLISWHIMVAERGRYLAKHYGMDRMTVVMDLRHVGIGIISSPSAMKLMKEFSHIDQHSYPENMRVLCIINAPMTFKAIWAAVKPLLEERVQKKMRVCSKLAQLFEVVPETVVPKEFGGKAEGFRRLGEEYDEVREEMTRVLRRTPTPPPMNRIQSVRSKRILRRDVEEETGVATSHRSMRSMRRRPSHSDAADGVSPARTPPPPAGNDNDEAKKKKDDGSSSDDYGDEEPVAVVDVPTLNDLRAELAAETDGGNPPTVTAEAPHVHVPATEVPALTLTVEGRSAADGDAGSSRAASLGTRGLDGASSGAGDEEEDDVEFDPLEVGFSPAHTDSAASPSLQPGRWGSPSPLPGESVPHSPQTRSPKLAPRTPPSNEMGGLGASTEEPGAVPKPAQTRHVGEAAAAPPRQEEADRTAGSPASIGTTSSSANNELPGARQVTVAKQAPTTVPQQQAAQAPPAANQQSASQQQQRRRESLGSTSQQSPPFVTDDSFVTEHASTPPRAYASWHSDRPGVARASSSTTSIPQQQQQQPSLPPPRQQQQTTTDNPPPAQQQHSLLLSPDAGPIQRTSTREPEKMQLDAAAEMEGPSSGAAADASSEGQHPDRASAGGIPVPAGMTLLQRIEELLDHYDPEGALPSVPALLAATRAELQLDATNDQQQQEEDDEELLLLTSLVDRFGPEPWETCARLERWFVSYGRPDKVRSIPDVMSQFAGREETLLCMMRQLYGPEPSSSSAAVVASSSSTAHASPSPRRSHSRPATSPHRMRASPPSTVTAVSCIPPLLYAPKTSARRPSKLLRSELPSALSLTTVLLLVPSPAAAPTHDGDRATVPHHSSLSPRRTVTASASSSSPVQKAAAAVSSSKTVPPTFATMDTELEWIDAAVMVDQGRDAVSLREWPSRRNLGSVALDALAAVYPLDAAAARAQLGIPSTANHLALLVLEADPRTVTSAAQARNPMVVLGFASNDVRQQFAEGLVQTHGFVVHKRRPDLVSEAGALAEAVPATSLLCLPAVLRLSA